MNSKIKKILKITVIICVLVLLLDGVIFLCSKKGAKKTFFDSINGFEVLDDSYVAVGSNNNNEQGYEKAKIALYDKDSKKIWEKLYNNKYSSSFFSVKKDGDSYIAVGNTQRNEDEYNNNVRSALIVKYDKDGKKLYENTFQVLGNSKFTNVLVVDDYYLIIGQSIYENMTLGLSEDGGGFIVKYDKNLKEISKVNYGGSKSGIYNDIVIVDDYIYTVGKDASNVGIISKYTKDLERVDTINYKYTDSFGFTGIASYDSNLYVVGGKKVKEDKNDYDTDALIVKYDLDLNKIDEKTYSKDGMERFNKLILDDKSKLIVAGQTGIYNKEKSTSALNVFSYDGLIAKYDLDLKEQFVKIYGDEKDDYFTDIKQDSEQYIISGYSTYEDNSYISNFIRYSKSGKLIGG